MNCKIGRYLQPVYLPLDFPQNDYERNLPVVTGLRRRNVTDLQWSQVDLERRCAWMHPD